MRVVGAVYEADEPSEAYETFLFTQTLLSLS